jgi:hypothetical protein
MELAIMTKNLTGVVQTEIVSILVITILTVVAPANVLRELVAMDAITGHLLGFAILKKTLNTDAPGELVAEQTLPKNQKLDISIVQEEALNVPVVGTIGFL